MDEMTQDDYRSSMLKAPFPWFGGKSRAAPLIWERLGNVPNYVEPFAGSLAVLLGRLSRPGIETINDKDGFVANVWRAIAADPEGTVTWADWPSNECDLHARHLWLRAKKEALTARLMADPLYYDVQIAGWWLWGIAHWIGGGWCGPHGNGPWEIGVDAEGVSILTKNATGKGVKRNLLHLGNAGQGVTRKRLHLMNAGRGVKRVLPYLGGERGVARTTQREDAIFAWFAALQERLRYVRVCCGDWDRVMGPAVTYSHGLTGVVLDPPYSAEENRDMNIYAEDSHDVAHAARDWCLANGNNPLLRIVLCGYGDVHDALLAQGWSKITWSTQGGMANLGNGQGRLNKHRERLWCSPACLDARQGTLF